MSTTPTDTVIVELCQRQSIGSRYYAPRVVECTVCTRGEAEQLLALPMCAPYYRRMIEPDEQP